MGGIKLDWHVESEQSQTRATEDPEARRRRQLARRQFLAVLGALTLVVGAIVAGILWRLQHVEDQIRRDLLDTVEAEVTALRIGDLANYMAIQRSASDSFMLEQSRRFEDYQQLKQAGRIQLTGQIVSTTIDDQRARVVVREILDGVPQHVVWFYWRYEDSSSDQGGWRHVPDDLTFWGEERAIDTDSGRVTYHTLDSALAKALAERLPDWWSRGCALLGCTTPPPGPEIDIVAVRPPAVEWTRPDGWTLRVTSPLVDRARADVDLPPDLARTIAEALAARLVRFATGGSMPDMHTDAAWLQQEYARWMAGHMLAESLTVQGDSFMESLIAAYGPGVSNTVLNAISLNPTLNGVFNAVAGLSVDQLSPDQLNSLDWRDYFQWRLALEPELLVAPDVEAFLSLYDVDNVTSAGEAALRLESPAYAARPVPVVRTVNITRENGQLYAWADTTYTENNLTLVDTTIIWRWANGSWRRVN